MPELVHAEIEGYESVRRLNEEEKILFPHAVKYAADACIKWFIEHGYEQYVESHRKRASSFRMPVQAQETTGIKLRQRGEEIGHMGVLVHSSG